MQHGEKISVTMTAVQLEAIRASVEAGEYASTSEALRDAVRLWQRQRRKRRNASLPSRRASVGRSTIRVRASRKPKSTSASIGCSATLDAEVVYRPEAIDNVEQIYRHSAEPSAEAAAAIGEKATVRPMLVAFC